MPARSKTLFQWVTGGALVCATLGTRPAHAAGIEPALASEAQKGEAQKRFDRGRELANAKKYQEALVEFRASFDVVASPNTHFSIARTLISLGDLPGAYGEFGKTIVEARSLASKEKRYAQTADAAEIEQQDLGAKLAFVTILLDHVADNATLKIGDRELDRASLTEPVAVLPGAVEILASSGGSEIARQSVTLATGEKKTILLEGQPKSSPLPIVAGPEVVAHDPAPVETAPSSGLRASAYVAGGVGVLGLATFAVFGALEKGTYKDLESACHGGPCPPDKADDVSKGRSQQTTANIGLAIGAIGLAAGAVFYFVSVPTKTSARAAIAISPGFVGIRGAM